MEEKLTCGLSDVQLQSYIPIRLLCFQMELRMEDGVLLTLSCSIQLLQFLEHQPQKHGLKVNLSKLFLMLAKTFRDWEKVSLNMRSPLPKEAVLPGASPDFVVWVYSMIVYSQRDRASASQVFFVVRYSNNCRL